jgi:hypothetical protein
MLRARPSAPPVHCRPRHTNRQPGDLGPDVPHRAGLQSADPSVERHSVEAVLSPGPLQSGLADATAISGRNAWTVGTTDDKTLIER